MGEKDKIRSLKFSEMVFCLVNFCVSVDVNSFVCIRSHINKTYTIVINQCELNQIIQRYKLYLNINVPMTSTLYNHENTHTPSISYCL